MSLYQCKYYIIPSKGNYSVFENLSLKTFKEDVFFDDHLFWESSTLKIGEIEEYLESIFPLGDSWSENLIIYGDLEESCIEIYFEKSAITSMSCRINFTIPYDEFLNKVIWFCNLYNLVLVDENLDVIELEFENIVTNIQSSNSFKAHENF